MKTASFNYHYYNLATKFSLANCAVRIQTKSQFCLTLACCQSHPAPVGAVDLQPGQVFDAFDPERNDGVV